MVREWMRWSVDASGQAALEFALVLPLLIFFLFGIFTVGYWMNAQQLVTQSAYQGARQGSLTNDNNQIQGAIVANLKALDPMIGTESARTHVLISPESSGGRPRGTPLSITITYDMPFSFAGFSPKFQHVTANVVSLMQCDPSPGTLICPP